MQITRVLTRSFELAMKGSLRWGKGSSLSSLRHVMVEVNAGAFSARAEAPVRPTIYGETVASIEALIHELFAPQLVGLDINDQEAIKQVLQGIPNNHTAKGALDMALADVRAQTQGRSLLQDHVKSEQNLKVSYILGIAPLESMLAEAQQVVRAGVRILKVKVGRDAKHDERIIKTLSESLGKEVGLYADANELLDPATAAKDLERLAQLGIAYIEEPLPRHLIRERAALKAEQIMPIIADDSCFTCLDVERELAFDTFDILNIKPARSGWTVSQQMLRLAKEAAKGVMVGSQASSGVGTVHAAIVAAQEAVTHPSELSFPLRLIDDPVGKQLTYHQGYLSGKTLLAIKEAA